MMKYITMLTIALALSITACGGGGGSDDAVVRVCASNTIIGTYNTNGVAQDISVDGNLAVVAEGNIGVAVFDVTNRNSPILLADVDANGEVLSARLHNNNIYAYVLNNLDSKTYLVIVDISNILSPIIKASIPLSIQIESVNTIKTQWIEFDNNYIHVLTYEPANVVKYNIYDITDTSNPISTGSLTVNGLCGGVAKLYSVKVKNDVAYIGSYKGLHMVNVSDRSNPVLISEVLFAGCYENNIDISGDILYAAGGSYLKSYNIADPNSVYSLDDLSESNKFRVVSEIKGTAYGLGDNGEISIIDVSNPSAIRDTNDDIFVYESKMIIDDEIYLYVADSAGLKIVDTCK